METLDSDTITNRVLAPRPSPIAAAQPVRLKLRPMGSDVVRWILIVAVAGIVAWIRLLPLSPGVLNDYAALKVRFQRARMIGPSPASNLPSTATSRPGDLRHQFDQWRQRHPEEFDAERDKMAGQLRSQLSYRASDGEQRIILGDYDSYHWLRMARNYSRSGTTCDAVIDGKCRDSYANAPVGRNNIYNRSPHIIAIVALHRLIAWFRPAYPLEATSFLVPVIVGALGVFPAFAIGSRLGGNLGGLGAALLVSVNPLFLSRSIGSDDDVWNVVLPLFMAWAIIEAVSASRLGSEVRFALLAAAFAGLHAATWSGWTFTYGVVLATLLGIVLLEACACLVSRCRGGKWSWSNLKREGLVLGAFYVGAGFFSAIAGAHGYFAIPLGLIRPMFAMFHPSFAAGQTASWPDVFSTVAELSPQNLSSIEGKMDGPVYFFVSSLGLLFLMLPRAGWKPRHFALLIGGSSLYWHLLTAGVQFGRIGLLALLAFPLAVALAIDFFSEPALSASLGAAFLVVAWFLAALYLAYQGPRFVMLMIPPFAIAFGVTLGRLQQWAEGKLSLLWSSTAWFSGPMLFVVMAAILIWPVRQGYSAARGYLPLMNAAWWDTLSVLRHQSPPDAIVNTWWDYGYWIKYVAERRVNNDGGSLRTHIIYWTARAIAAPSERETAGLLRMLDCGSDATPEPEAARGAYGKLLSYGVDGLKAQGIIIDLARLGRQQAQEYLAEQKISPSARADILTSTHCDPPPSYLLLSSTMESLEGWWNLANWDFRRTAVVDSARLLPETAAEAYLVIRLGYSEDEARSLYKQAASLRSQIEEQKFIEPTMSNLNSAWAACVYGDGGVMTCNMNVLFNDGTVVKQAIFNPADPTHCRLVLESADAGEAPQKKQFTPPLIMIAGSDRIREVTNPAPKYSTLALVIDLPGSRVRLSSPALLDSTFNQLMYFDDRYGQFFDKVYEETGFGDERVTLWKVNWKRLEAFD